MANEKWYRIEWNDELWTGLMSVSPGQVEANIGRRNAEDMVIDEMIKCYVENTYDLNQLKTIFMPILNRK